MIIAAMGGDDHSQSTEYVRPDGGEALFADGTCVLDRQSEGVIEDAITFGRGYAVLADVRRCDSPDLPNT